MTLIKYTQSNFMYKQTSTGLQYCPKQTGNFKDRDFDTSV